jgi:hypothetical protein
MSTLAETPPSGIALTCKIVPIAAVQRHDQRVFRHSLPRRADWPEFSSDRCLNRPRGIARKPRRTTIMVTVSCPARYLHVMRLPSLIWDFSCTTLRKEVRTHEEEAKTKEEEELDAHWTRPRALPHLRAVTRQAARIPVLTTRGRAERPLDTTALRPVSERRMAFYVPWSTHVSTFEPSCFPARWWS